MPGLEGNEAKPLLVTNQFARPFEAQGGEVFDIAVSGDRKLVAVASAAAQVTVYRDRRSRLRIAAIANVPAPVYGVSPQRRRHAAGYGERQRRVRVFELPAGKQLKARVAVPVANVASEVHS